MSDLIGLPVVADDGRSLGHVHDLHLVQDGPVIGEGDAAFRLHGLVAGRGSFATRLGYADRGGREVKGPMLLRALVRWLHRRAVYVPWTAVTEITDDRIVVTRPHAGFEAVAQRASGSV